LRELEGLCIECWRERALLAENGQMFYFTFGNSGKQVFEGGWVRIKALTFGEAVEKFKARYGERAMRDNFVNCASMYTEEEFKQTGMAEKGNLGGFEQDYIEIGG